MLQIRQATKNIVFLREAPGRIILKCTLFFLCTSIAARTLTLMQGYEEKNPAQIELQRETCQARLNCYTTKAALSNRQCVDSLAKLYLTRVN